jgi:hypothetical protein
VERADGNQVGFVVPPALLMSSIQSAKCTHVESRIFVQEPCAARMLDASVGVMEAV